jgi:TatA/E family protein of Tat protein translocase
MLGIGHFPEIVMLVVIALIIFGPKRLPELGSALGKSIREFRKATDELHDSVMLDPPRMAPVMRPPITAGDGAGTTPTIASMAIPPHSDKEPART